MLKRIRRLPSPALVISCIALVLAIGGGSFALAISDNHKDKKIAKKVANKQIRRKAPGLSVNHANTANFATNADTTNQITSFTYAANNGSSNHTVLNNFHGLTLNASCTSGANNGLTVTATSATSNALIGFTSISEGGTGGSGTGTAHNNSYSQISGTPLTIYSPSGFTSTTNGSVNVGYASGQIVYSQPGGGSRVSVDWFYEGGLGSPGGHDCYWSGTVVGTSNGPADVAKGHASPSTASGLSSEQRARKLH